MWLSTALISIKKLMQQFITDMRMTDLDLHAEWIVENLTQKNVGLIDDAYKVHPSGKDIILLANLATIVKDRSKALCNAIDRGECDAEKYPDFRNRNGRMAIAEKMLLLLESKADIEA